VRVFSVHDADAAGTLIQHTLQHATLARAARAIEITDLGLQPWEGVALGLPVEMVPHASHKDDTLKHRPVGKYVRARTDRAPNGDPWAEWLQHNRIELNAFTSADLIAWLDQKMVEHSAGKLIPPDDILHDQFSERVRERVEDVVATAISRRLDDVVATIKAEEAEAKKPLMAALDHVSAPLMAELNRVRGPLLAQMRLVSEPFRQRIRDVHAEAAAIDREAEVEHAIQRMTPGAEKLRSEISAAFTAEPIRNWKPALREVADATEVGDIDIDLGGAP